MEQYISFGSWVQRRRKLLGMTQADLASKVSCSLSMLRKIEREVRRPSDQLAGLLARHLSVENSQVELFLKMARGIYVSNMPRPVEIGYPTELSRIEAEQQKRERAPFVARERELRDLHLQLTLAANGKGRIIFISGEAGRGKTSLLSEFARQAIMTREDLLVAGGSSDVYSGSGAPLLPFRDIYRLLAGDFHNTGMDSILTSDLAKRLWRALPETAKILLDQGPHLIDTLISGELLEQRLAAVVPQKSDPMGLLVRLRNQRTLSSSNVAQELRQDRLFEEISSTLIALARRRPLLLMLDDLHWVDSSTATLLGHLVMRLQRVPILIIGSFRPEDLAHGTGTDDDGKSSAHPLVDVLNESQRQFGHNRIELDHPNPEEELDFVSALLDADDNAFSVDFRKRIAQMTEGHPLFIVELLQDMKDRGDVVRGEDGRWRASEILSWEHLPARVEGVIDKRITRLPAELREFLKIGSVQGETFLAEVISKITGINIRVLTQSLNGELDRRHRLIRGQGINHTAPVRLSAYQFRHHLYQKYLYGRLSEAEKMYLNEEVGTALE
ncbi:MAG: AAA family ATPase, partial [Candidatus Promineifilaceae bacterium]